jgi:cell division protein FtsL
MHTLDTFRTNFSFLCEKKNVFQKKFITMSQGADKLFCLLVVESLFAFSLGISEMVFINFYPHMQSKCENIYNWILAASFINIIIPIITACGIRSLDASETGGQFLQIAQIIIMIWATITYFHIDSFCLDLWLTQAPEIWTFVLIHFAAFWIFIIIAVLLFFRFVYQKYKSKKLQYKIASMDEPIDVRTT